MRRRAICSRVGSSVSSSATLRYSSHPPRSLCPWLCSSVCFSLYARPLFIVIEVLVGSLNIGRLFPLVPAAQQQHASASNHGVINPIARSPVDSEFTKPSSHSLADSKMSLSKSINPLSNSGLGLCVGPSGHPFADPIPSRPGYTSANLDHSSSVTYKLPERKPFCPTP